MPSNSDTATLPESFIQSSHNKILHSLVMQLNESQWWEKDRLEQGQVQQLRNLLAYSIVYSSFYKERLKNIDPGKLSLEQFREIPVLTRTDLQSNRGAIDCSRIPESHGKTTEVMTSGSTAEPVSVLGTGLTATIWNAVNLREHLWHQRNVAATVASIRWRPDKFGMAPAGVKLEDWGLPINQFYKTAAGYYLNSSSNVSDQLLWLQKIKPTYLMTHPSNMQALVEESQRENSDLSFVKQFRTLGESVNDEHRKTIEQELGRELVDFYSSQEMGYIALQCPEQNHYHVQAESLLVEVLREDGTPCEPFEAGRLVITSLRNYATPLIRYEVGDYGEIGLPCSCGRGLPVLNRINGRVRNMLHLPGGERHWPNFGFRKIMDVAELRQFQIVQHSLEKVELKLVVEGDIAQEQEQAIKKILQQHLGYPFEIEISYHPALHRSASGKFEDFVSLI